MNKFCDPLPARLRVCTSFLGKAPGLRSGLSSARLLVFLGLVPVLAGVVGCASSSTQKGSAHKAASSEAPDAWRPRLGKVALVDQTAGFVLLDIGTAPAPSAGTALRSYTQGGDSADLTVSTFQRRPYLIANIQKGHPAQGDAVVLLTPGGKPEKPALVVVDGPVGAKKGASRAEANRLVVPAKDDSTQYLPVLTGEGPQEGVIPGLPVGPRKPQP